ncbi:hypothetical protein WJX75_004045 [Coccomyxa subellipsoidea]|uniref:Uncharacterized protein n=1 Tax=Coccomyxa subellipsoidea TaxID=248742 RepID=A0ABR2YIL8_9CHLO
MRQFLLLSFVLLCAVLPNGMIKARASPITRLASPSSSQCGFKNAIRHVNITGWEFELLTPLDRSVPEDREQTLERVTTKLQSIGNNVSIVVVPRSLRTSVTAQESHAISTGEGRSLVDNQTHYPWQGPGFLRLRAKIARTYSEEEGLGVHPGSADLTLKLKDVDLAEAPALEVNMSRKVRPRMASALQLSKLKHAHLKVKVENDVYCTYANRANSEFKYSPVPSNTNITTLARVSEYFSDLPRFLGIPADWRLPLYSCRAFSKSVWDLEVLGVRGVANLVMNYLDAQAALLGSGAQNTELSFRLKRTDIEKVHVAGDDQYYDAVDEVIRLCDLLHDERWDQDSVAHAAELMQS